MKISIFVSFVSMVTALVSSSAFASPVYQCQPTNSLDNPAKIYVISDTEVSYSPIINGGGRAPYATQLTRNDVGNAPDGYVEFTARGGCPQDGPGPHCYAIWTMTLFLTDSMLAGEQYGKAIQGSQNFDCQLQ